MRTAEQRRVAAAEQSLESLQCVLASLAAAAAAAAAAASATRAAAVQDVSAESQKLGEGYSRAGPDDAARRGARTGRAVEGAAAAWRTAGAAGAQRREQQAWRRWQAAAQDGLRAVWQEWANYATNVADLLILDRSQARDHHLPHVDADAAPRAAADLDATAVVARMRELIRPLSIDFQASRLPSDSAAMFVVCGWCSRALRTPFCMPYLTFAGLLGANLALFCQTRTEHHANQKVNTCIYVHANLLMKD